MVSNSEKKMKVRKDLLVLKDDAMIKTEHRLNRGIDQILQNRTRDYY